MAKLCKERGNETHRQLSIPCWFMSSSRLPTPRARMFSPLILPFSSWILPLFSTSSIQSIHNSMCRVETSLCFLPSYRNFANLSLPCPDATKALPFINNRKAAVTELCWFFLCHVRVHMVPSSLWKPNAWISHISTQSPSHTLKKRNYVFYCKSPALSLSRLTRHPFHFSASKQI